MFSRFDREGVDGLILDAVGTLIDPEPSVSRAYAAAARRQGVELDVSVVKSRFGKHFRDDDADDRLGPMVTDEANEYRRWRRIVGQVLPELPDPDRAFEELWHHFGRPEAWRVFPDVAPALEALSAAGLPVRIASNFDSRLRNVVAGLPGLEGCVGALVISSEIGYRKPHAAFYREACRDLGLPPGRVLCVGDDPENDVLGPGRAGLRGVLLDRDDLRPEGVERVPDLSTLVGALLGHD